MMPWYRAVHKENIMNSIRLKTSQSAEKLPVGSSRFLGNPDVWEGFRWPSITVDGEEYDLSFLCQINCAEAAPYDTDHILPKTGMLYFFYDLDEMPWEPSDPNAARVIYYDGDMDALREMVLVDETGAEIAFKEQRIEFACVDPGFLSDCEETHLLLGVPSLDYGTWYECIDGWQMLLQIDSFETEDAMVNFTDEGVLCFYAEPEKVKDRDFSDVRIMQIYS